MIDAQLIFDILIAIVLLLLGWLYSGFREEIKEMKTRHDDVAEKVQTLEVLMPREYVSKTAFERALDELKASLVVIQQDVKTILRQKDSH